MEIFTSTETMMVLNRALLSLHGGSFETLLAINLNTAIHYTLYRHWRTATQIFSS